MAPILLVRTFWQASWSLLIALVVFGIVSKTPIQWWKAHSKWILVNWHRTFGTFGDFFVGAGFVQCSLGACLLV